MICNNRKYFYTALCKSSFSLVMVVLFGINAVAQKMGFTKTDSTKEKALAFYHAFTSTQSQRPYTHIDYTRPNNQLMSWPDFPLTPTELERRHRQYLQENKPAAVIAKDIITNILKKKQRVAVIPKF